jgi:ferrous iron transport protein B
MGNMKWTLIAVGYQTGLAYVISLIVYQFGTLFSGGSFNIGTLAATAMLVLLIYLIIRPNRNNAKNKEIWKGAVKTQGG